MFVRLLALFTVVILPALLLSACGPGKVAASKLERVPNPGVSSTDVEQLVDGNTAFAFDLYRSVRSKDGNLVYSPYSMSLAFAMTYGGADGETAAQMAAAMHYTLPEGQLHPAFNVLDLDLAGRPDQVTNVDEDDTFQMMIANSVWGQEDWPFLPEYLDLLAANYGAGMRLVDFITAPERARNQINDWVSDQTKKHIRDIIPPGKINPLTRMVLANAIYFKGSWEYEFDAGDTGNNFFYLLNGDSITIPMMKMDSRILSYASGSGWQAVSLPYAGGLTEMVILVPDAGNFEAFESALTAEEYEKILSLLQPQEVLLHLPKFKFDTGYELNGILAGMGMRDAFDVDAADFSRMDGERNLYISDAIHKAFIAVDEKGTEAGAATVVIMTFRALPMGINLTVDRPFFFVIRDVPTGTILFMGRVLDPR